MAIPAAAGAPATLATVTLAPGSWLLDGRATITNDGTGSFFDCNLQTANGAPYAYYISLLATRIGRVENR